MHTEFFSLSLDVVPAFREAVERLFIYALTIGTENLESAVLAGHFCLVAQALELFAQYGVRHGAQHGAGPIHRAVVPCAPPVVARDLACLLIDLIGITKPLGQSGQIGDHGVDVALRIRGAARIVREQRIDEISGSDRDVLAIDMNPGFSQILLCPCHRLFDGGHMRGEDPFVAGNESEERSRLRHRECEITAAVAGLGVANLFAVGQFPAQNSFEGCRVHRPG